MDMTDLTITDVNNIRHTLTENGPVTLFFRYVNSQWSADSDYLLAVVASGGSKNGVEYQRRLKHKLALERIILFVNDWMNSQP